MLNSYHPKGSPALIDMWHKKPLHSSKFPPQLFHCLISFPPNMHVDFPSQRLNGRITNLSRGVQGGKRQDTTQHRQPSTATVSTYSVIRICNLREFWPSQHNGHLHTLKISFKMTLNVIWPSNMKMECSKGTKYTCPALLKNAPATG